MNIKLFLERLDKLEEGTDVTEQRICDTIPETPKKMELWKTEIKKADLSTLLWAKNNVVPVVDGIECYFCCRLCQNDLFAEEIDVEFFSMPRIWGNHIQKVPRKDVKIYNNVFNSLEISNTHQWDHGYLRNMKEVLHKQNFQNSNDVDYVYDAILETANKILKESLNLNSTLKDYFTSEQVEDCHESVDDLKVGSDWERSSGRYGNPHSHTGVSPCPQLRTPAARSPDQGDEENYRRFALSLKPRRLKLRVGDYLSYQHKVHSDLSCVGRISSIQRDSQFPVLLDNQDPVSIGDIVCRVTLLNGQPVNKDRSFQLVRGMLVDGDAPDPSPDEPAAHSPAIKRKAPAETPINRKYVRAD